jgi:MerR family transcriptional regulator/heat shock protein HspR
MSEEGEIPMKKRKGFYSISVVSKMFSVHQQTIRMYEKEGLITPKRSEGNTRLFSEEDVERLEEIINLTHKMGVNLIGVEIILKLQKKMKRMQDDMNKIFNQAHGQLEKDTEDFKSEFKKQAERIGEIKNNARNKTISKSIEIKETRVASENKPKTNPDEVDDWQIDYEDNI